MKLATQSSQTIVASPSQMFSEPHEPFVTSARALFAVVASYVHNYCNGHVAPYVIHMVARKFANNSVLARPRPRPRQARQRP